MSLSASIITLCGLGWAIVVPPPAMSASPQQARTIYLPRSSLPKEISVPDYAWGIQPFESGKTLLYQASWMGIPAATVKISFAQDNSDAPWIGQMWLATDSFIDLFYRMRDYAHEEFSFGSCRPTKVYLEQYENRRHDRWYINFDDKRQRAEAVRENREGKRWIRVFDGGKPFGPFSGSMWALSQKLDPGSTYVFDVFCGGSRFVFALAVRDREKISTVQGSLNTLRIEPTILWASDKNLLGRAKRLILWVSDDSYHVPVRIEASTFIGSVRLDLTKVNNTRP